MHAAMRFIAETPMRVDDVHLVTCPLYHSTAFGFLALSAHPRRARSCSWTSSSPRRSSSSSSATASRRRRVVPTMLHRVLALGPEILAQATTRARSASIFSGGAPLPGAARDRGHGPLRRHALQLLRRDRDGPRHARASRTISAPRPAPSARPSPATRSACSTTTGARSPPGEVGELYVRNKMLVAGYHNDDDATRASMNDGFFSVGDLARRDRDGRYFIEGRKRDMIISGGVNVYPAEVEARARGAPRRRPRSRSSASPIREWGERVRAFVVRARARRSTRRRSSSGAASASRARRSRATSSSSTRCPRNPTGQGPEARAAGTRGILGRVGRTGHAARARRARDGRRAGWRRRAGSTGPARRSSIALGRVDRLARHLGHHPARDAAPAGDRAHARSSRHRRVVFAALVALDADAFSGGDPIAKRIFVVALLRHRRSSCGWLALAACGSDEGYSDRAGDDRSRYMSILGAFTGIWFFGVFSPGAR